MTDIKYEFCRGSDILRDGMFLELSTNNGSFVQQIADVFYSDITHDFFLTCYEDNIPLVVIEELISKAKKMLPLIEDTQS